MNDDFDDDGLGPFRGLVNGAVPLAVFWFCVALVAFSLFGCGGGDIEEPVPTPRLDCNAKPEMCK